MTDVVKKHPDVFVVERYYDNGVGGVMCAFLALDEARAFSDEAVAACRTPHEVAITRCAPIPRETWRRFANDRRWTSGDWEHRKIGEAG